MPNQHATVHPDEHALGLPMLLRALRRFAVMSQRELAVRAGVPTSTIARIEAGTTADPLLSTLERVVGAAGCRLAVVPLNKPSPEHKGLADMSQAADDHALRDFPAEVTADHNPGPERDRRRRYFPAHLKRCELNGVWWGWERVAWELTDHPRPRWIYFLRPRYPGSMDWAAYAGAGPD